MGLLDVEMMFDWPEIVALTVLIAGFVMSIFAQNTVAIYSTCFIAGLVFGRLWYKLRKSESIPLFLAIMAFFLGFILGGIWTNLRAITLLLLAGILAGYWIHKKKILRTI